MHAFKEVLIEIKPSTTIRGEVGLFAARDVTKGKKILTFASEEGALLTNAEFNALHPDLQKRVVAFTFGRPGGYLMGVASDFNALPTYYYANHSCEGNMGFDEDGDLVALRDIACGEEVMYDYGLVEANPNFSLECLCGAATCRGRVTGLDWQDQDFQKRRWPHFHPDIKERLRSSTG